MPDHLIGRTVGTELALALLIEQRSAANRVAQAEVIVRHHPRLLALVGTGHVSMTGLRLVLRQTAELADDSRRMVDAQVAELATSERLTPARLGQAAARLALAADPQAAAERAAAARARRRVWLDEPLDGVAGIGAVLRAEEALACWTALDRTARAMRQHGDERSVQNLMADLVVERLTVPAWSGTRSVLTAPWTPRLQHAHPLDGSRRRSGGTSTDGNRGRRRSRGRCNPVTGGSIPNRTIRSGTPSTGPPATTAPEATAIPLPGLRPIMTRRSGGSRRLWSFRW
ncbi:MAG TPA: DUF222 domain-containing protein [Nocardioidaceae bacterium]|nr:DUF222 domain-containing protein [Nocardioidaceae bacterium]